MSLEIPFTDTSKFIRYKPEEGKTIAQCGADKAFNLAGSKTINGGMYVPTFPPHLDWETSTVCNLSCKMCFRQELDKRALHPPFADFNLFVDTLKQLKRMNALPSSMKFNFRGEPLCNPQLEDFIHTAKELGVADCRINTNGILLDEDRLESLAEAGLDYLIISVDAASSDTYRTIRGEDYMTLVANIERAIQRKKPWVHLNYVVQYDNLRDLRKFMNAYEGRVHAIRLIKDRRVRFGSWHPCKQPFQRLVVCTNGDVRICCGDYDGRLTITNIAESDNPGKTLYEAWHGGIITRVRNKIMNGEMPELCKPCKVTVW